MLEQCWHECFCGRRYFHMVNSQVVIDTYFLACCKEHEKAPTKMIAAVEPEGFEFPLVLEKEILENALTVQYDS